jgi:hypothetical protein
VLVLVAVIRAEEGSRAKQERDLLPTPEDFTHHAGKNPLSPISHEQNNHHLHSPVTHTITHQYKHGSPAKDCRRCSPNAVDAGHVGDADHLST